MNMNEERLEKAKKLFWAVKGHIPDWLDTASDEEIDSIIGSYTLRLWNNNEGYLHFEDYPG